MKYLNDSFSVNVGGPAYADGWDRIFGKSTPSCCGDRLRPGHVDRTKEILAQFPRPPLKLQDLQARVKKWGDHNFPNTPAYRPLLGVGEELGELNHAHLKNEQGIRGTPEKWLEAKKDAVGDIIIYLVDYCNKEGLDLEECIRIALTEIEGRDWIKYPLTGKP